MWKKPPLGDASITCRAMDEISLESLTLGFVALNVRQAQNAMPLKGTGARPSASSAE